VPLFADRGENAHKVWHADFVTDEDGTGIAHQAPGYGEDDYTFAKANDIPFILDTDEEGFYTRGPMEGETDLGAQQTDSQGLKRAGGIVWKIDYIKHEYPHCHRCGTKLTVPCTPKLVHGRRLTQKIRNARTEMGP
jgi:isoleucyl-tRNA synthetase